MRLMGSIGLLGAMWRTRLSDLKTRFAFKLAIGTLERGPHLNNADIELAKRHGLKAVNQRGGFMIKLDSPKPEGRKPIFEFPPVSP